MSRLFAQALGRKQVLRELRSHQDDTLFYCSLNTAITSVRNTALTGKTVAANAIAAPNPTTLTTVIGSRIFV